jgi:hypothetical protein
VTPEISASFSSDDEVVRTWCEVESAMVREQKRKKENETYQNKIGKAGRA